MRRIAYLLGSVLISAALLAGCGGAKLRAEEPLGRNVEELIREGRVEPGMTGDLVRESKGKPDHIHVMEGGWGSFEQWVYGGYEPEFVYLLNGRVVER